MGNRRRQAVEKKKKKKEMMFEDSTNDRSIDWICLRFSSFASACFAFFFLFSLIVDRSHEFYWKRITNEWIQSATILNIEY
jgi:hypothetical protein